ncbi:MAG: isochorismatase family cysteine hydrolase [Oscillospiraceae bacterium]|nr:isochorismatase family cysteine hydrolase [Oscillospiraceae bacterium]
MKKLLVIVDYQNDFVSGALGSPAAAALDEGIAAAAAAALDEGGAVLFTRDTHGGDYLDTREGRFLPVPHCIAGTGGHHLYGQLAPYESDPRATIAVLDKSTFGSPDIAQAARKLCGGEPEEIVLCGVVTNICVLCNAVLLHTAFPNSRICVRHKLCAAASQEAHENALSVLKGLGIELL